MKTTTHVDLAARFKFSAELLAELSHAIEADALAVCAQSRELAGTAPTLREISCVHQRLAVYLQQKSINGSKQQRSAASGNTPEAPIDA